MTKQNIYKYFGRNGVIVSLVFLDYANRMDMYQLVADEGKVLTNGERKVHNIIINKEDLKLWSEIPLDEADINK
jgi:hypothetical protein